MLTFPSVTTIYTAHKCGHWFVRTPYLCLIIRALIRMTFATFEHVG